MDLLRPTLLQLKRAFGLRSGTEPNTLHLSNLAQLYMLGICSTGVVILLQVPSSFPADKMGLVTFLVLGSLAQLLPIRFYKDASVSLSMAVVLATILVFGPIYGVWVNLASGIVHYLTIIRPKNRPFYRAAVTTCTLVIAAWVSGHLYIFAHGAVGPASVSYNTLPPLLLAGMCYYLLNTLLISCAMALEQRRSLIPLLQANYRWLTVNIAALTPLGFGIAFIYEKTGLGGLAVFLLPVVIAQYSFHLYARTVEDVRKANEDLKQANDSIHTKNEELCQANEFVSKSNQELHDANERLNIMYLVSRSLVGSLHLAETLDVISNATKLLGFRAGFVANILGGDSQKFPYWRANHPAYAQWSLAEPDGAVRTELRKQLAVVAHQEWFRTGDQKIVTAQEWGLNVAEYQLSDQEPNPLTILTLVPLFIRGEPWGILGVGSPRRPSPIEMNELLIFRTMAENALDMALAHEQAERDALIDARTGLFNHRYFQEAIQRELRDAAQRNAYLSFLMLDINHFKEFNDFYGHLVGDQVLEIVAKLTREAVRESDIVCRYGGDEMCVLLPQSDRARAMEIAARIDRVIRTHPFRLRGENGFEHSATAETTLRVSIGVATFPDDAQTRAGLVEHADRGCYRAKLLGGGVAADPGHGERREQTGQFPQLLQGQSQELPTR